MSSAKWRKKASSRTPKQSRKNSNVVRAGLALLHPVAARRAAPLYKLEVQLYLALVDFSRARGVQWHIGLRPARLHQLIVDQIFFNFFTANIGQNLAVNFDARRKRLTALGFHFPTKGRVLDDVFLGVGQIVFGEHGPNAGAPATIRFL